MLDFATAILNQTAGHPIVLTTALLHSAKASFYKTSGHPLIYWTLLLLIVAHAIIRSAFKRDVHNKTFGTVYDAASLLSNPDSVLCRDGVKDSIITYETLYSGARKETCKSSTNNSIQSRREQYQKMVNNFYDLVTDFYEWGWGQVNILVLLLIPLSYSNIPIQLITFFLHLSSRFTSHQER